MRVVSIFFLFILLKGFKARKHHRKRSVNLVSQIPIEIPKLISRHEANNLNFAPDYISPEVERGGVERGEVERNLKLEAAQELLGMFNLQVPLRFNKFMKKPPKYMVDLYNAISHFNGSTKTPDLLQADIVRSIPNRSGLNPDSKTHPLTESYDYYDKEQETIFEAELHVYIEKKALKLTSSKTYFIKVIQISPNNKKLLMIVRRIPMQSHGWQILPMLATVTSFLAIRQRFLGLSIEIVTSDGVLINLKNTPSDKLPIIVTFSRDRGEAPSQGSKHRVLMEIPWTMGRSKIDSPITTKRSVLKRKLRHKRSVNANRTKHQLNKKLGLMRKHKNKSSHADAGSISYRASEKSDAFYEEIQNDPAKKSSPRTNYFSTFSTLSDPKTSELSCRRYSLYVDFEELGWSGWIIAPQGYNAYHCKGGCAFPLSKQHKPSSHATVQSVMHILGLGGQPVDLPCCTPDKLYDINLLYFDPNDYVVLHRYKDMVAGSCACR